MKSRNTTRSTVGLLLTGLLILSGCTAVPEFPDPGAPSDVEATQNNDSSSDISTGGATIPGNVHPELPLPDYDVIDVTPTDMGGHEIRMRGTDIEADAEVLRTMLLDAGFSQRAWGITEENGANGIFIGYEITARITVHNVAGQIEIQYGYNPKYEG